MLLEKEFSLLYYLLHHAGAFESQRDLAKKLGVSSAAPFRHFPSKRALLAVAS